MMSDNKQNSIRLDGCAPEPLVAYLKALGILRLVAEQKDSTVCGYWENQAFNLRSRLEKEELEEFFLREYEPSSIIAPWNGGSGFYPKDNKTSIEAIRKGSAQRFSMLGKAIEIAHEILDLFGLTKKPETKEEKDKIISCLRARLPDEAIYWLDAAVVMTGGSELKYPPLLGTGGNDGRLDFTNNYMQRLAEVINLETGESKSGADSFLQGALYAKPIANLPKRPIGQFSPGDLGGPNSGTGFEGESGGNPWDLILLLEGSLLFSGGITRRLEAVGPNRGSLIYPFTVRAAAGGSGAVETFDDESARGELWLPTWEKPASLDDLRVLFREGRLSLGKRVARNGLDAIRAINALGADRRMSAFHRYILAERNGKAYLATPLGRFLVGPNPKTKLIDELEKGRWLQSFRKLSKEDPVGLRIVRRVLDDSLFEMAKRRQEDPTTVQQVLISLGKAMTYLATIKKERPMSRLSTEWVSHADDSSDEYRIAVALAGLGASQMDGGQKKRKTLPLCFHMAALDMEVLEKAAPIGTLAWEGKADKKGKKTAKRIRTTTWGTRKLVENLVLVAQRRKLLSAQDAAFSPWDCPEGALADCRAISAFLEEDVNDDRISAMLQGLVWARSPRRSLCYRTNKKTGFLPFPYTSLKPLFTPPEVLIEIEARKGMNLSEEKLPICPPAIPGLLAAGNIVRAIEMAMIRMRICGFPTPFAKIAKKDGNFRSLCGKRLLAALLIPVENEVVKTCLKRTYADENSQTGDKTDVAEYGKTFRYTASSDRGGP